MAALHTRTWDADSSDDQQELIAANRRLLALVRFGRTVRAELELRPLLRQVCRGVVEATGSMGAVVALHQPGSTEPEYVDAIGIDLAFFGARGRDILQRVLSDREPSVLHLKGQRQSAIAVPLAAHGEHIGALIVLARSGQEHWGDEVSYVAALGDEAAIAIHNARLYAVTRRELRNHAALRRVVESFSAELDLDALLDRIVSSAVEMFHAVDGVIALKETDGVIRFRSVYRTESVKPGDHVVAGVGLSGLVLNSGAPVLVDHYRHDVPDPYPRQRTDGPAIGVPIYWKGELRGVFTIFAEEDARPFGEADREAVELLAIHAAIAIENARLYGEVREQLDEIVGLQQLGALLLEEHDFDRVLQSVCEQLLHLTDAGGVGLSLVGDDPTFLEMRTVVGPSAEALKGARIPIQGSFAGEALRTNQPQRSDDAQNDPRGYRQSLVLGQTHSILSVPMKTRQRVVGVLSIYNKRNASGFTDRDAQLATLFANQAAVAIDNARLYEQTREYAVVEERNRLSRELHDSVTQSLFSITLLSQAALNLWDRDTPKARERLERAHEVAQGALAEMRALLFQLRPAALQEEGLLSAVRKHLAAVRSRDSQPVELVVEGTERQLPHRIEEAAFRIIQESLNNVVKHARANRATVTIEYHPERLRVCTEDDGVGFAPGEQAHAGTLGMSSMRERAEGVGGHLSVKSAPDAGTRVCTDLPLEEGER